MSNSTSYDYGLLDTDLTNTFPTFAPTGLAGFNSNYSGLMPGGSFSSFGSGFDLNQISKLDPGAQMLAISAFNNNPKRQAEVIMGLLPELEAYQDRRAEKAQKLGLQSNLWGAAIKSISDLPKTIAESAARVREGRLAGQQAILNQAQRPYNISGFNMPYTSYRI
jgi:hypothetical protein